MAHLKFWFSVLLWNCLKTDILLTIFMLNPPGTKMILYMWRWFSPMFFRRRYDKNHLHIYKITFVPGGHSIKIISELSVLGQFPSKTEIWIFRGAIIMIIYLNLNWMGTLIKEVTPDSFYFRSKNIKSEINFSGFPKNACQGFHISERTS